MGVEINSQVLCILRNLRCSLEAIFLDLEGYRRFPTFDSRVTISNLTRTNLVDDDSNLF